MNFTTSRYGLWHFVIITAVLLSLATGPAWAGSWKNMAKMPTPVYSPHVGGINGILYAAGGWASGGETSVLQGFDPTTNTWTSWAPMPDARNGGETGVINSQLYVAGGAKQGELYDTLFAYDSLSNTWTTLSPMSHLSAYGVGGVINGQLYVTTGAVDNSGQTVNYLDVYNPATGMWTSLPGSSFSHAGGAGGVINGKFYVASGATQISLPYAQTAKVEVYDPATNAWTTLKSIPNPVRYPASAVIDGKLYVFGGNSGTEDGTGVVNYVQVYDPIKDKWTVTKPTLPTAAFTTGCDVVYGIAFIVGGADNLGDFLNLNYQYYQSPSIP